MAKKLLVISAHSADFCTRSGGTIIKFIQAGYEVKVVCLTYGEKGESAGFWMEHPGGDLEECKRVRRQEVEAACAVLGVKETEFLDWGDYPLILEGDRISEIGRIIREYQPTVVFTHSAHDEVNEDHAYASVAVKRALTIASAPGASLGLQPRFPMPELFFFESSVPQTEFNGFVFDNLVDITSVYEQKMKAVECFSKTQGHLVQLYTGLNARRGQQASGFAQAKIQYAEAFERWKPYVGSILPISGIEEAEHQRLDF